MYAASLRNSNQCYCIYNRIHVHALIYIDINFVLLIWRTLKITYHFLFFRTPMAELQRGFDDTMQQFTAGQPRAVKSSPSHKPSLESLSPVEAASPPSADSMATPPNNGIDSKTTAKLSVKKQESVDITSHSETDEQEVSMIILY